MMTRVAAARRPSMATNVIPWRVLCLRRAQKGSRRRSPVMRSAVACAARKESGCCTCSCLERRWPRRAQLAARDGCARGRAACTPPRLTTCRSGSAEGARGTSASNGICPCRHLSSSLRGGGFSGFFLKQLCPKRWVWATRAPCKVLQASGRGERARSRRTRCRRPTMSAAFTTAAAIAAVQHSVINLRSSPPFYLYGEHELPLFHSELDLCRKHAMSAGSKNVSWSHGQYRVDHWLHEQLMTHPARTPLLAQARVMVVPFWITESFVIGDCNGTTHLQRISDLFRTLSKTEAFVQPGGARRHLFVAHNFMSLVNPLMLPFDNQQIAPVLRSMVVGVFERRGFGTLLALAARPSMEKSSYHDQKNFINHCLPLSGSR